MKTSSGKTVSRCLPGSCRRLHGPRIHTIPSLALDLLLISHCPVHGEGGSDSSKWLEEAISRARLSMQSPSTE